jgi:hypothetical protein
MRTACKPALPGRALLATILVGWGILSLSVATAEVNVEARTKLKWSCYPTRRLEDLGGFTPAVVPLTKYGGRADRQAPATGFFRVQRVGDRWWFVDPAGGLFLQAGIGVVTPHPGFGSQQAFARLFGDKDRWAATTLDLLRTNGFNGTGHYSDRETLSRAKEPLPYTVTLHLASGFGKQLGIIHPQPGHMGFAGDCFPALHPGFAAFCEGACRQLASHKDDPWLIGCFSDNELPGNPKLLDNALAFDEADAALSPLRRAAWDWLRARKGQSATAAAVTDADREAFLEQVYETYFRITTEAIRRHDPNHLCLGPRLYEPVLQNPGIWAAAGRHLEAIAVNYYGTWTPRATDLANWHAWSGKPCLITEFHTKGADTPLANRTGAGWVVKTQEDRGLFYQNYTLALLESKTCVGWHWFKYMDNDPTDTTTDPSNRDSNKGIVTIQYEPYPPLLQRMKAINLNLYPLADFFDRRK